MNDPILPTISMDASGRLVLPKAIRQRLNLRAGARLQAAVVAGHLELVPISDADSPTIIRKSGLMVLAATGKSVDAATAVTSERSDQESRGLRR